MRDPRTTTEFLTKLRLRLLWPATGGLTNTQLLSLASDCVESRIWPLLEQAAVDYLTTQLDFSIPADMDFETQGLFSIPAEGYLKLQTVWYVSQSGQFYQLERYIENELPIHTEAGHPHGYFFRGGRIGLHPRPRTGFVRIQFNALPFPLVELDVSGSDTYRRVASYAGDLITTDDNLPTGWDGTSDILVCSPQAPYCPVAYIDAANITSHASNELGIDAAAQWPTSTKANQAPVLAGDLLIHNYRSPLVQVPTAAYSWLLSLTEELATDGRTDQSKKSLLMTRLQREEEAFLEVLQPRDAEGQTYVPEDRIYPTVWDRMRWRA